MYLGIGSIEDISDFFQEMDSQFTCDNPSTTHHYQSQSLNLMEHAQICHFLFDQNHISIPWILILEENNNILDCFPE